MLASVSERAFCAAEPTHVDTQQVRPIAIQPVATVGISGALLSLTRLLPGRAQRACVPCVSHGELHTAKAQGLARFEHPP